MAGTTAHAFWVYDAEVWWDRDDALRINYILHGPGGFARRTYVCDIDGRCNYDPKLYREMARRLDARGIERPVWATT